MRLKKFGADIDQEKINLRKKKFGNAIEIENEINDERKRKIMDRKKKFCNTSISELDQEKITKRKNKFGPKEDLNEAEKKKKRIERFKPENSGII